MTLRSISKIILSILFVLVLIIAALLLTARYSPERIISLVESVTDYQIEGDEIQIRLLPASFRADNLNVSVKDEVWVSAAKVDVANDWWGRLLGKDQYLRLHANGLTVAALENTADSESAPQEPARTDLHQLLAHSDIAIQNASIELDEGQSLRIEKIEAQSTDSMEASVDEDASVDGELAVVLDYIDGEAKLPIVGNIRVAEVGDFDQIRVQLDQLDLRTLLRNDDENADSEGTESISEAPIEWAWVQRFADTQFIVDIGRILLGENILREAHLDLTLDDNIAALINAEVEWKLGEQLYFHHPLRIDADLVPLDLRTHAADLEGSIVFAGEQWESRVDGRLNVNGIVGNQLTLIHNAALSPFIATVSGNDKASANPALKEYFPQVLRAELDATRSDASLVVEQFNFGDSDLEGEIDISQLESESPQLVANLKSETLSLSSSEDEEESTDETADKVFSEEAVDWSWLDRWRANGDYHIDQLQLSDSLFAEVALQFALDDGELEANVQSANFAEGEINAVFAVQSLEGDRVRLNAAVDADGILLGATGWLPPKLIEKGKTTLAMKVAGQGNSSHDLAASLNGEIGLEVADGTLETAAYEALGADFVAILDALNPLSERDPYTQLECIVINLKVDEGRIISKDSIAVATEKLSLVADGEIDLGLETIQLSIDQEPRTGSGIGISSLVKFVALGGTLSQPSIGADAIGVLQTGLAVGAVVTTGGVSMLAEGALNRTVETDKCEIARKAFSGEAATKTSAEPSAEQSADDSEADVSEADVSDTGPSAETDVNLDDGASAKESTVDETESSEKEPVAESEGS